MKKRDFVLIVGLLAFLVLIIFLSLLLGNHFQPHACGCPKVISQHFIWLFILFAVLFVGALVYYLLSLKIEIKDRIINRNIEILYTILDKEEKKVLDIILRKNGKVEQAVIANNLGKLKAHRVLKKLQNKKIIDIKKQGKANIIKLKSELLRELI